MPGQNRWCPYLTVHLAGNRDAFPTARHALHFVLLTSHLMPQPSVSSAIPHRCRYDLVTSLNSCWRSTRYLSAETEAEANCSDWYIRFAVSDEYSSASTRVSNYSHGTALILQLLFNVIRFGLIINPTSTAWVDKPIRE